MKNGYLLQSLVIAGRKYNPQWESEYPWLRYSVTKNAAYCVYCILFGNTLSKYNRLMVFQHSGFTDWKNAKGSKRGALPLHEASESHKMAAMKAVAFKLKGIQSSVSSEHEEQVKRNRSILLSIIDVIIALG